MKLHFMGANATVTGSRHLVETGSRRILIDCGLYQGEKELRLANWRPFPIAPGSLDAIVLTHAHLDHSGFLPRLVRDGYRGPIYCTQATLDLCEILLPDSGRIQEEDAETANRLGYSKHAPALPLYTEEEARKALTQLKPLRFEETFHVAPDTTIALSPAGHILGAAMVTVTSRESSALYSGDLGNANDLLIQAPAHAQSADALILESTYGDRLHSASPVFDHLESIIRPVVKRGGTVIIPSFAVGRAQLVLYYLLELRRKRRIPKVAVYVDSPMATHVGLVFRKYRGEHRLSDADCDALCDLPKYVTNVEASHALQKDRQPKIVIAGSGMATGGRVLGHLETHGRDPGNAVIFVGYQAPGTRGAKLIAGEKSTKIRGRTVKIEAQIHMLDGLSAHADQEGLIEFVRRLATKPKRVFLVHGELAASQALGKRLVDELGLQVSIPRLGEGFEMKELTA